MFSISVDRILPSAAISADRCFHNFMHLSVLLWVPSVLLSVHLERHHCCNSSRILDICPNFSGMMHSTMKQVAVLKGLARPILCIPRNLEIFHGILGPSLWDKVTPPNFRYQPELLFQSDARYHETDCYCKWRLSANFLTFHRTLKFSMIGLK